MNPSQPPAAAWHFVISSPRSGSTWLARALNRHPYILATENRLYGHFCQIWSNPRGQPTPRITADCFLQGFSRHSFFGELGYDSARQMEADLTDRYIAFVGDYLRERSGKPVIVDKVTPYPGTTPEVMSAIEKRADARLIHLIRDGRDVAVSGVFDWITRENTDSRRYQVFVKNQPGVRLRRFFDEELLQRWTDYWLEPIGEMRKRPATACLEIRYEAMLNNQPHVLNRIFRYLDLSTSPDLCRECAASVTFEKTTGRGSGSMDPLAKTRKGVAGDWKNYFTREDAKRFQELTGNLLQELGYETDHGWVDDCPRQLDLCGQG
jgi:hypothetical protein